MSLLPLKLTQRFLITLLCTSFFVTPATGQTVNDRPRAREIGLVVGIFPTGPLNAITDVAGVRVGQVTVNEGDSVRTGITAILPHGGNIFRERVPAAIYAANGFGKLLGVTQVRELGELETPILLTCTLCVWKAADAMVDVLLAQQDMQDVGSINPVVGETNDGLLNDIRNRPIRYEHVVEALSSASTGPVEEGSIGAGTGTWAFGWKGGVGTSSRRLSDSMGGYTVGVLVQTNFGGVLTINGAPVGRELGQFSYQEVLSESADGSIMIVVATDAPLDARLLERLSRRAIVGLARTGASMSNGSGDYVIAFSTTGATEPVLENEPISPLFQAVAEATEEAIYNSLFRATTVEGHQGVRVEAIPLAETVEILQKYGVLGWNESLPPGSN
jgi:D-aminopeptidase